MCGIAGIISTNSAPISEDEMTRLAYASSSMRHRGPDDDGLLATPSGMAAFAHRRLSIIDPALEAHQPMISAAGNVLVFNGEIYNYRELAAAYNLRVPPSDTAVLLALLELRGLPVLREFRGFFTFAWWNESTRHLIIARDAFGKKPLYYSSANGRFKFASELRALLRSGLVPFELSSEGLASYLRWYCVPHSLSIIEGVQSLEPGSIVQIKNGTVTIERWYRLPEHQPMKIEYVEAVRETRRILERSVRDRLVSDVPVGAFLSGGIDSNAITALAMREASGPIQTFSIGFDSKYVENETTWAKIGAERYGTHHHQHNYDDSEVSNLLPHFFESMDSPTGDGLNAFLVARATREFSPTLKVVLSGVGGDEAFLGYKKYRWLARRKVLFRLVGLSSTQFRFAASELLVASAHSPQRAALRALLMPDSARALFSRSEIATLTNMPLRETKKVDTRALRRDDSSPILAILRSDIEEYMPNMLMRDLDAMTMSQSLEARAPFLDRELMEFSWQLPISLKVRGGSKQLLADAVKDIVPNAILQKPKTGFELPMREWLTRGALHPELDALSSQPLTLVQDGLLSKEAIRNVYQGFSKGRFHYMKPWSLIALERWHRTIKEYPTHVISTTLPRSPKVK